MTNRKKKKRNPALIPVLLALAILLVGGYLFSRYYFKPPFVHYKKFGINLPSGYTFHGIDVSRYQGNISWKDVKEMEVNGIKIGFAFIKATEGVGLVDGQFRRNWFNVGKAGVTRGAYHFFIASKSGKIQADNFLKTVQLEEGDLYPVLDVEEGYNIPVAVLQRRVAEWLNKVEKKYKVKPIIYTNVDFYNNFLAGKFDDYPLWVAHYVKQNKPGINREWHFWQHNETGRVSGIRGNVDFNVFYGDSADFKQLMLQ